MKTVKQIIRYFRLMSEPDNKQLAQMAYESAKAYYADKPHTRLDFQTYQRAYVGEYRRIYAKNKIANS